MITLTSRAAQEVRSIFKEKGLSEGSALRLGVAGGGCSGLSYTLDFAEAPSETDLVLKSEGITILCDEKSLAHIKGLEVDFNDGLLNRGWVFRNPNATGTCGCGTSFSV